MKSLFSFKLFLALIISVFFCSCISDNTREFYHLKTYTFNSAEQMALMDNYLAETFLPALKNTGVKNVGVFKTRIAEKDSSLNIYVLIPYNSLDDIQITEDLLNKTETVLKASATFTNEQPPYARQSSVVLRAFEDMPMMLPSPLTGERKDRIYELRSYESATEAKFWNKVDMFNAGGEIALFKKLNFNAVFYGEVLSGPKMPNLMYMTTFKNQKDRDLHWKEFVDSPEWNTLKGMPEYQKNVSKIDIYFLYPTEYSDY
ncbi:MAG: NIPSNAP family protein [Reichenbachiella sp.]